MASAENTNLYREVKSIISWLRAEGLQTAEKAFAGDTEKFNLVRSRILRLFGQAWGAEKKLKEIFDSDQPRTGQSGNNSEICGEEDDPMSG